MATTSSGMITSTTINGTSRVTGLSSGVDVDSMVEQMMSAEKAKLNKLKQSQQLAEWRQEAYQTVISDLQNFSDKYFNLTSSTSLLKQSTYLKFDVSCDSGAVAATASASAKAGTHTLAVSQLATAATRASSGNISKNVQGDSVADYTAAQGTSFSITLDGTKRTVNIDSSVTAVDSLQTAIDSAVGEDKVEVSTNDEGYLVIEAVGDSGVQKITLGSTDDDALAALGFGNDSVLTNRLDSANTLETIAASLENVFDFNEDGQLEFTINGVDFTFDKDETLDEMILEINSSDAGVTMKYNTVMDKLMLSADETGAGNTVTASETESNFFAILLSQATAGTDAKLNLDSQALTRSSNSVTVDGITYTLKKVTSEEAIVDVAQEVDSISETISSFVEEYNALIEKTNLELNADYDYDYPPLTDDQKDEMTDDEIADWEETAKTGVLENDALLRNLQTKLRTSLIDSVSGVNTYLIKIGITTEEYTSQGKLIVDEATLKQAIQDNPEDVMNLFCQQSSSYSGTLTVRTLNAEERKVRYQDEGIAYRFYDIIQDNIGTTGNSQGNKGLLLEKAGLEGDSSETDNTLSAYIDDYQDRIDTEEERLDDLEEYYYAKFTTMETYISTMSTQLASFSSDS